MLIVTGLPRSGTSLMMQILAYGGIPIICDGSRLPDIHNPRGYYECDWNWLKEQHPAQIDIWQVCAIKLVDTVISYLPPTKGHRVIFMRRHIDEITESYCLQIEDWCKKPVSRQDMKNFLLERTRYVTKWVSCWENIEIEYYDLIYNKEDSLKKISDFIGKDISGSIKVIEDNLYRIKVQ